MSRVARATLAASAIFCVGTVWGVHFLQQRERQTMYQGVVRDDARRLEKQRERQDRLDESLRKREVYEKVQVVAEKENSEAQAIRS
ncbi:hypothetical protein SCHPADRAFT_825289 [Schizopora paradoxa]|uniref:Cytochrome c oxidase assembly protein n=1 Tax=Schizopora paradoxa TaxID=27342 RepID=A0A0H2S066_9AGAM|nr:hypothetical protein SCHPADRAFT_825289 [Schizopora paradoxa]